MKSDIRSKRSEIFADSFDLPLPPKVAGIELSDAEFDAYKQIISGKAYADWLDNHLVLAAECAKVTVRLARLRQELSNEDDVVPGRNGVMRANPKYQLIEKLTGQQLRYFQVMGLSAGRNHKGANRRRAAQQKQAREVGNNVSLLATPD